MKETLAEFVGIICIVAASIAAVNSMKVIFNFIVSII